MKTNFLLKIVALFTVILLASCSKDNDDTASAFTAADIQTNAKIDQISNDVADIIDDQYAEQNPTGRTTASVEVALLPPCVTVNTTLTNTTWTRTIDFGTTGCAMPNGAVLRGVIIISGSLNYTLQNYVISYTFVNFYHNDMLVQGNRTITRSFGTSSYQTAVHPINVMDINMTFTTINGNVYSRVGTRTRECVEGFDTRQIWTDNVYVVTGSWATTFPNGIVHSNAISETSPLRILMNCDYRIVSGTVNITRPNHTAVLDYGTGACDNNATISIDGGAAIPFTFGN